MQVSDAEKKRIRQLCRLRRCGVKRYYVGRWRRPPDGDGWTFHIVEETNSLKLAKKTLCWYAGIDKRKKRPLGQRYYIQKNW